MGILTQKDATIFRNFFKEMARLRGLPVIYKYPIDMKFSNYAEEIPTGFSEDIHIDIIFDENPKTSTLRKYGWVSELPDDKPYMATIPFDVPNLCKGCRIIIPSHFPNEQVILSSYSQGLASEFGGQVKDIVNHYTFTFSK